LLPNRGARLPLASFLDLDLPLLPAAFLGMSATSSSSAAEGCSVSQNTCSTVYECTALKGMQCCTGQ
jgi:hypothetical protein